MNVQIPAVERINMSLDDLIKARRTEQKKTRAPKPAGQKVSANPTANAARSNKKRQRNNQQQQGNGKSPRVAAEASRAAKSVGETKAKRNAQINARRGLQSNATPTKKEVKKEVNKQLARAANSSGLKISFKPGELAKTTEKTVSQQIKAVLARQSSRPGSADSKQSAGSAGSNQRRAGPKVRGKNTTLRVVH